MQYQKYVKKVLIIGMIVSSIAVVLVSYLVMRKLTSRQERKEKAEQIRAALIVRHQAIPLSFVTDDSLRLSGMLLLRPNAEYNVLLCHGYHSYKESLASFISLFERANIMLFDFRAHGQSEGALTTIGCDEHNDVIAAAQCMRNEVMERQGRVVPLVILGLSMGGAAALKAAAIRPDLAQGIIIDSAYADLWEIVRRVFGLHSGLPQYPFLPVMDQLFSWYAGTDLRSMRPVEYVNRLTCPLLFIHSCSDEHTPASDVVSLYSSAPQAKRQLWIGPACKHGFLIKHHFQTYKKNVITFLKRFGLLREKA